ncbi:hypothetical protein PAXRUDRAFT_481195 [Paxillus rubicundulus Ve08.2h10]|uniref:Uncharacterized protein n=1 Tax=Paxillus rubicundulus Ve08.2h10 TaxID=930991 RepID=A0A0D0E1A4_9AGAM|nr:hypothetical protein PAXRUDRAFT_481195 [Paxillus rubicundulus Ve08.2h10]
MLAWTALATLSSGALFPNQSNVADHSLKSLVMLAVCRCSSSWRHETDTRETLTVVLGIASSRLQCLDPADRRDDKPSFELQVHLIDSHFKMAMVQLPVGWAWTLNYVECFTHSEVVKKHRLCH